MDKEIKELLESQINNELQASYNYLGASIILSIKRAKLFC